MSTQLSIDASADSNERVLAILTLWALAIGRICAAIVVLL